LHKLEYFGCDLPMRSNIVGVPEHQWITKMKISPKEKFLVL